MICSIYVVTVLLSILFLTIFLVFFEKHVSAYYVLLCAAIIVSCMGGWQVGHAKNVGVAIAGTQVMYLGSCFLTYFMLQCIADLSHIKIPKIVNLISVLAGVFILACVMTIGIKDLYYSHVGIMRYNGLTYMTKEYGPFHILYLIYIFFLMLYGFGMVIYAFFRKKETAIFSCVLSFIVIVINVSVYVAERMLQSKIEWMPIVQIVSLGIILIQLHWVKMYDIKGFSSEEIEQSNLFGFILMDGKGRFEGADTFARKAFPELNVLRVGRPIGEEESELFGVIRQWMNTEGGESHQFQCGDKYVRATHTRFQEGRSNHIHCIRLQDNSKEHTYQKLMEGYNEQLEKAVEKKTKKFLRVQDDIITSMASIVENRDNNTGGHIVRTSTAVNIFIHHLLEVNYLEELTEEVGEKIIKAAPLHDFGKISIPDAVLNKPGKFTEEEYAIMKQHSAKGAIIVARILQHSEDIVFRNLAVNIAHFHHERWDGTGYPEGLQEKEIPFEARVMALADVFDALVTKRTYKEKSSFEEAFQIIQDSAGTHFDPKLCACFIECRSQLEELYGSNTD